MSVFQHFRRFPFYNRPIPPKLASFLHRRRTGWCLLTLSGRCSQNVRALTFIFDRGMALIVGLRKVITTYDIKTDFLFEVFQKHKSLARNEIYMVLEIDTMG